jgi:hypothetical protein
LNWPAGLLLDNRRAVTDLAAARNVTNPELDEITATQLAIDRQIKQRSISHALVFIQIEPNSPDISRLERAFRSHILSSIPGAPLVNGGVKI